MSRVEEILQLLKETDSQYSEAWTNDLLGWLSDREDAELVEIMRGCASVLAYRMVGDTTMPSAEVFRKATNDVATAFMDYCKELKQSL